MKKEEQESLKENKTPWRVGDISAWMNYGTEHGYDEYFYRKLITENPDGTLEYKGKRYYSQSPDFYRNLK